MKEIIKEKKIMNSIIDKQKLALNPIFMTKNMNNIDEIMEKEDVYNNLRAAHSNIKSILYDDNFKDNTEKFKNCLEAIHSILYMAEEEILKEKDKN